MLINLIILYKYVSFMNIYHLKYFLDAARLGSVSKSAQLNLVGHSAVSQAIKSLEEHFGVPLIFHSKRLFQLTPEGELCLTEAAHMLNQLEEIKHKIQTNTNEVRGELTIWAPQSLIVDSLYQTLEIYQKRFPLVKIKLFTGAATQVRSAVLSGNVHIGLVVDDGHLTPFNQRIIKSGEFILVDKYQKSSPEKRGLIVSSMEKVEVHHLIKNYKSTFKKNLPIKMEVMSWGVIKTLVEKDFGVGYVPDYCVTKELSEGRLQKLPSPRLQFKYQVKAIWAKNKQLPKSAQHFVDLLKAQSK